MHRIQGDPSSHLENMKSKICILMRHHGKCLFDMCHLMQNVLKTVPISLSLSFKLASNMHKRYYLLRVKRYASQLVLKCQITTEMCSFHLIISMPTQHIIHRAFEL